MFEIEVVSCHTIADDGAELDLLVGLLDGLWGSHCVVMCRNRRLVEMLFKVDWYGCSERFSGWRVCDAVKARGPDFAGANRAEI